MAVRLKTRWHRSKRSERNQRGSNAPKKLEDLASVIAINIWKLAKEVFVHMEKEGFHFREDTQVIAFINEFIFYQLHIADRLLYGIVEEQERTGFIQATADYLKQSVVENQIDLLGPSETYGESFIRVMNERMADYASCGFSDGAPGYDMTRYLAQNISQHMQQTDNKWVVEQIMDVEAPSIVEKIVSVVTEVLGLRQRKQQQEQQQ